MKTNQLFNNLKAKNYKAFLLFLSLTIILWFIIQMTKTYTLKSEISVKIEDVPNHVIVDSLSKSLNIVLKLNGLKTWKYNISDKTYSVPFNAVKKDSNLVRVPSENIRDYLNNNLGINYDQITINENFLDFAYKRKASKYVPVESDFTITYSPGYNSTSQLSVTPDSVLISGSEKALKDVKSVKTEKINLKNINKDVKTKANLIRPDKNVSLNEEQIELYLKVERFSEKFMDVDIRVVNLPDSVQLNIFPESAKISFLISLNDYDKVSKLDFEVACDYKERFKETGIMIPKITGQPDYILNPKLNVKRVDYLVKSNL